MVSTNAETREAVTDGRATRYFSTEEKARAKLLIIEELSKGMPFEELRRNHAELPNSGNLSLWKEADAAFARDFAHARELGYDMIAYDCLRIANTPMEGAEVEETKDVDGNVTGYKLKKGDMLGHRKLQIETRLNLLAKWDPKRYGDRKILELDASDRLLATIEQAESRLKLASKVALKVAASSEAIDV